MIDFRNKKYELFFSNNLPPLVALNYADELFFEHFEPQCGVRYRILSIIKQGLQEKYILKEDLALLKRQFELKTRDYRWIDGILQRYENGAKGLRLMLEKIEAQRWTSKTNGELISELKAIRSKAAPLDAASNLLYLFSSLEGGQFLERLRNYSKDEKLTNRNFIFYTQPIKESRFAKIQTREIEGAFSLSKEDANLSKILRVGAYIKDDVSELLELRRKKCARLFEEIAKRLGCTPEDLEYLQLSEIEEYLQGKTTPQN